MTERALTQQVTDLVRKLFWRNKSAAAGEAQPNGSPVLGQAGLVASPPPGPIVGSRLQLIGLARVKTVLGDRWPKLAHRARGIAQTIIEKNLLPGDVYEVHGDDEFVVLFPQLSPKDAHFKSQAIGRQIEERLIGSNLADVSACAIEVFTVDPGQPVSGDGEDELPVSRGASSRSSVLMRGRLSNETTSSPQTVRAGGQRDAATTPLPDLMVGDAEPNSPAAPAQNAAETANDIPTASISADNIQWMYRPVWDFKRSTLMMFALLPLRLDTTGMRDAVPVASMDKESLFELDNAALSKGDSDLEVLSNSGRRLPILAQIHHETIVNARRRALFLGKVKSIPADRRKLISFEIVDCPPDGLTLGLTNFIAAIRGCGARMAIRVHTDWRDFRAIERCGIKLATMDASDSPLSEAARIAEFEKFADRTGSAKLESGVWGLSTRSLVVGATSAGIRYLTGNAIAAEVPNLSHALRFTLANLYLHH